MFTSKSPLRAVAVCANTSLLIHSMVSPTLAETSAGVTTRSCIVIWIVAACAGTAIAANRRAEVRGSYTPGRMAGSLFQAGGDVFGVLLMALKDFQAGLQQ